MIKDYTNVLKNFPYSKRYYITHPHKFISECWTNLTNAWMRVTRGWSYQDLWNMSDYLLDITIDMLHNLARDGHGYPGVAPFEEPGKWISWLYYIAGELEESKEENYEKRNEYHNEYMKQFDNWEIITDENGNKIYKGKRTELDEKYFAREKELVEEATARRQKALSELVKYFDYLWD